MSPDSINILHISDIHFGRIDQAVLEELRTFIFNKKSDLGLVILTGDLTQRAKKKEFQAAREFLESLDCPVIVVPGNHDVPLYNIFLRFLSPYSKFCKYLGGFSQKYFEDERIAVYGMWSTNPLSIKDGMISSHDLDSL
ncbi:MAG: metallophosphoesterase, partial [Bdellovibrionales bacterium]|nr:metallophosphoesterase [Bdellovibrionales bacterium]